MATVQTPRRSSRVFIRIRVYAQGRDRDGRRFRELSETIVVNAHGALIYLNQTMAIDTMIMLVNPVTEEEQECRVVYLGEATVKGQRIGVEFLCPSPRFWGLEFPPGDWVPLTSPAAPVPPN